MVNFTFCYSPLNYYNIPHKHRFVKGYFKKVIHRPSPTTPTARGILAHPSDLLVRGLTHLLCGQHPQHPAKGHCPAHTHGHTAGVCLVTGVDKGGFAVGPTNFKCRLVHHWYNITHKRGFVKGFFEKSYPQAVNKFFLVSCHFARCLPAPNLPY